MRPYSEKIRIKTHWVDFKENLTIYQLVNILQDYAAQHAEQLGFGRNFLNQKGWFWVLYRLQINICSYPKWRDLVKFYTWPKYYDTMLAYRDFAIKDLKGNVLITATSSWVVLDIQKRRPVKMSVVFQDRKEFVKISAFDKTAPKISLPKTKKFLKEFEVLFSDLDMNLHTNNANYVRKLFDSYPLEFLKKNFVESIALNFLKESFYSQKLKVYIHNQSFSDNPHFLSIENSDNQTVLTAQIFWKNIQS